jgi:hypothetical protein
MKYLLPCLIAVTLIACQETINEPAPTYQLSQNFPNPFTDTTIIYYGIPLIGSGSKGPWIRIVVNDRFNQTFAILVDNYNHPACSNQKIVWNSRGSNYEKAPSGIYYIELQQLDMPSHEGVYVHERRVALKQ